MLLASNNPITSARVDFKLIASLYGSEFCPRPHTVSRLSYHAWTIATQYFVLFLLFLFLQGLQLWTGHSENVQVVFSSSDSTKSCSCVEGTRGVNLVLKLGSWILVSKPMGRGVLICKLLVVGPKSLTDVGT